MLGNEEYDDNWAHKLELYKKYFDGKLLKTYETGALSSDIQTMIEYIIEKNGS